MKRAEHTKNNAANKCNTCFGRKTVKIRTAKDNKGRNRPVIRYNFKGEKKYTGTETEITCACQHDRVHERASMIQDK